MNFIKEKKTIIMFLAIYVFLIAIGIKYRIGINDEPTLSDTARTTLLVLSTVYFLPTTLHLFFKGKLLREWFLYSFIFTVPIMLLVLLITLHPSKNGFVGGEIIVLLPIAVLALLLFITTPFYLHSKSKKIKNIK